MSGTPRASSNTQSGSRPVVRDASSSACPVARSTNGNCAPFGPTKPASVPIDARIGQRVVVAGQQQMIAVVDREIGRAVEIGTAAPAGLLRGLVHANLIAGIGQPHGRRKAGNSGADDMNGLLHQMNAYRRRMAMRAILLSRTGARGACEAARDQQIQDGAIVFRHDPRRAHGAARIAVHDLVGFGEMLAAPAPPAARTTFGNAGSRYHGGRIGRC